MGGVGVIAATWAWFPPAAGRLSHPRDVLGNQGDTPIPPAEGDSPSAFSLLVADVVAPIEIRQRSHWEAGESQVTPVYLNEYKF